MSTPLPDPEARLAQVIARAERRRSMLERLGEAAMAVSIEIATRFCDNPGPPERGFDPGRSFAAASRAVRFTLAMEAQTEGQILALCKGDLSALPPATVRTPPTVAPAEEARPRPDEPHRRRVREAVREAIEREHGESEAAERLLGRVCVGLFESEAYEALLAGDFDACVAVICAEVGVSPVVDPSPLAGDGGPRSGPDEGSTEPIRLMSLRNDANPRAQRDPSSGLSGHLLPQGQKESVLDVDTT